MGLKISKINLFLQELSKKSDFVSKKGQNHSKIAKNHHFYLLIVNIDVECTHVFELEECVRPRVLDEPSIGAFGIWN